jgi:hypothetical protein
MAKANKETEKKEKRGRKAMPGRSKMTLYFPDQEYVDRLKAIADGNRRTLNQEIIHALDKHMKHPPHP